MAKVAAVSEQWMCNSSDVDSILLLVFIVSPNKQKRGFLVPTTLDTTGPL